MLRRLQMPYQEYPLCIVGGASLCRCIEKDAIRVDVGRGTHRSHESEHLLAERGVGGAEGKRGGEEGREGGREFRREGGRREITRGMRLQSRPSLEGPNI